MTDEPQVWYWAEGQGSRPAFTAEADQALKDKHGNPVLATGLQKGLVRRAANERAATLVDKLMDDVWEHLLDLMEQKYEREAIEQEAHANGRSNPLRAITHQMNGVVAAIAIVEYNHLWKTNEDEARDKVKREAEARYLQAVEE